MYLRKSSNFFFQTKILNSIAVLICCAIKKTPGISIADIDECSGNNSCHVNANCTNKPGGYDCKCKNGYIGDGFNCIGK